MTALGLATQDEEIIAQLESHMAMEDYLRAPLSQDQRKDSGNEQEEQESDR